MGIWTLRLKVSKLTKRQSQTKPHLHALELSLLLTWGNKGGIYNVFTSDLLIIIWLSLDYSDYHLTNCHVIFLPFFCYENHVIMTIMLLWRSISIFLYYATLSYLTLWIICLTIIIWYLLHIYFGYFLSLHREIETWTNGDFNSFGN